MKKKAVTLAISYVAAAFIVLGGFCIQFYLQGVEYERSIAVGYGRSFGDVADILNNLSYSLEKTQYVSTDEKAITLAAEIWNQTSSAKAKLDSMPVDDESVMGASKFLTQTGEYVYSLAKTRLSGGELTQDDVKTLAELSSQAKALAQAMTGLQQELVTMNADYKDIISLLGSGTEGAESGIVDADLSGAPTLIYDGPYSENLYTDESVFLRDKPEVSEETALSAAEKACGGALSSNGTADALIKCFYFSGDNTDVFVTANGGFVKSVYSYRAVGDAAMSDEDAVEAGRRYLEKLGYNGMESTYYIASANVLTVMYAYTVDGVMCYPDQIKVCVALDDGDILSMDATGYLQRHDEARSFGQTLTVTDAQTTVSGNLAVFATGLAVIPTDGGKEKFCWEFKTKNSDGQTVIVYVNAVTGAEEDILILVETENGTLTQ